MRRPLPTHQTLDAIAPQLSRAQALLQRHLAGSLHAIHLFGSAVNGGLKPWSDIDLLATVHAPPAEAVRRALMADDLGKAPDDLASRPQELAGFIRHARAGIERLCTQPL